MYDIVNETKRLAEYVNNFELEYIKSIITRVYPDVDLNNIEDFRKFYVMMAEKNDLSKFGEDEATFLQERAEILQEAREDLNDRLLEKRKVIEDERQEIINEQQELSNEIEELKSYIKDNSKNKSDDNIKKEISERKEILSQKIDELRVSSDANHKRMLDYDLDLEKIALNLDLFYDNLDLSNYRFFDLKEKDEIDNNQRDDEEKPDTKNSESKDDNENQEPEKPEKPEESEQKNDNNKTKNERLLVPKDLKGKSLIEKFNSLRDFEKVKFLNAENGYERLNNAVDILQNSDEHLSHNELKTLKLNCSYFCYNGNPEIGNGKLFKNEEKIKKLFTKVTGKEEVSNELFDTMYGGRYRGRDTYVQCNLTSGGVSNANIALIKGTIYEYADKVKDGKIDEKDMNLFKSLVYGPLMMGALNNKVCHMGIIGKVKNSFSVNSDIFDEYEKMAKECLVEPPKKELEEIKKHVNNNPVNRNGKGNNRNNPKRKERNDNEPKGPGEK